MFARIIDGIVAAYPFPLRQLALDNPNTSFPAEMTPAALAEWGVAKVQQTPAPQHDAATQGLREKPPVDLYGTWTQQWEVYPLSGLELEAVRRSAVPAAVSPRQIRQALTRAGLRTSVEAAVAAGDQDIKDWWEFATEFQRNNQHVIEMGIGLGVTERQLDDLWTLAGSL